MKAGLTDIKCGTRIRTTKKWDKYIVEGEITHAFGSLGGTDYGAIAGIYIDKKYQEKYGFDEIGNLFRGDFEVLSLEKEQDHNSDYNNEIRPEF